VTGGDSGGSKGEAFAEASLLEKPSGRELDTARIGLPVGNLLRRNIQCGRDDSEGRLGNDGILEEGASAARVSLAFDDQHAFAVTDLADGVVDLDRRGGLILAGKVTLQVGVGELWGRGTVEAEGDLGDDVAVAMGSVEEAAAVGKAALLACECGEPEAFKVKGANLRDGVGDLLPVGPDVLYGRAADGAGDAGEALDAADSLLADLQDEAVPAGARCNGGVDRSAFGVGLRRCGDGNMDDQAVKAAVVDEEIAAATKNEDRQMPLAAELYSFEQLGLGVDLAKKTRWAADAKGGVRGEEDLLLDQ